METYFCVISVFYGTRLLFVFSHSSFPLFSFLCFPNLLRNIFFTIKSGKSVLFHQLYLRFSFILLLYGFLSTLKHFKLIFIRENIWIYFLCYIYRSFLFILANSNLACPFTFFLLITILYAKFIYCLSLLRYYLLTELTWFVEERWRNRWRLFVIFRLFFGYFLKLNRLYLTLTDWGNTFLNA